MDANKVGFMEGKMKKTFLLLIILSMLFASCTSKTPDSTTQTSQVKGFVPGKSTLPGQPEEGKNYYLVEVSKDVLSTPIVTKVSTSTMGDEKATPVEISSADLTTDKNGVAVVADSKISFLVPVVVLDKNQKPVEGISISYISEGDRVLVTVYDSKGYYKPQLIAVQIADLRSGISQRDVNSLGRMLTHLLYPVTAFAAPQNQVPVTVVRGIIALLEFADTVYSYYSNIQNGIELGLSQNQVLGYSGDFEYVCKPPEYWTAFASAAVDTAIVFLVPDGGLAVIVYSNVVSALVDLGLEAFINQPVLYKRHIYTQAEMDAIIHKAGHVGENVNVEPAVYEKVDASIGKCVEVPDLSTTYNLANAREILTDIGVSAEYIDVLCEDGSKSCEGGYVFSQDPGVYIVNVLFGQIQVPYYLAIHKTGEVIPRMSLDVRYMVLKPPEPLPLAETEPPPTINLFGQIAFESDRSGQSEVYILNVQTKQITQLTFNSISSGQPNWSPDGKILAYASTLDATSLTRGIFVMPIFPQLGPAQLINGDRAWAPKWSLDGRHIAYVSDRSNTVLGSRIFIMNADGSDDRYLSPSNVYGYEGDITWSPDSSQIYFTAVAMGQGQIFSNFCVTKADEYNPICPPPNLSKEVNNLDWSPDGQGAVFTLQADIYKINSDGTGQTRLTETSMESNPTWSPDGKYIAFVSNRDGNQEIYVMDADGNNETNMTNNPSDDTFPDWTAVSFEEPIDCQGSLATRLHIGDKVYISYRPPLPNRLRAEPNLSAKILDLLKPGTAVEILDGYACGGDFRFWKVKESNGLTGWTAEGDLMNYWLVPGNPPAEATSTEAQIRYVIADIQLGGVDNYYRQFLDQPAIAEAIRRWDAGVRVVNISQFERKIVGSWMIVYAGTENQINGLDVLLTTDTPSGSSTCDLAGITNPTYSTDFSHGWLNDNDNEMSGGYDYSNGGQVTFLYPGVNLSADQGQTAYISFQPYWGTLAVKLVNRGACKIALMPTWTGASWTQLIQNGYVYMVLDVDNSIENAGGIYYEKFGDHTLSLLNNRFELVEGDEYTVVFDLSHNWFKLYDKNGKLVIDYDLSGFWGVSHTGHIPMGEFPWWTIGAGWTDTSYPTDLVVKEVCYGTSQ